MRQLINGEGAKWLSRDPLPSAERSQGPNLYDYVRNNPVDLNDPLGLCPCGQHLEFDLDAFENEYNTITGGTLGGIGAGAVGTGAGIGSAAAGESVTLGVAAGSVPLAAASLGIGTAAAGLAIGSALSPTSWHCVADGPPDSGPPAPPPGNYYPTPNNSGNGYNPNYNPYTGSPSGGSLPNQL